MKKPMYKTGTGMLARGIHEGLGLGFVTRQMFHVILVVTDTGG